MKLCRLLFLFFLLSQVSALIVKVYPSSGSKEFLYNNEIASYIVEIQNDSDEAINDVKLKIVANENLKLFFNFNEYKERIINVGLMMPYEKKSYFVFLKPEISNKKAKNASVLVYYGTGSYNNFIGRYIKLSKAPLLVSPKLKTLGMDILSKNNLTVELKNISSADVIRNIKISLLLPKGFNSEEQSYTISYLQPSDSVKKFFEFRTASNAEGRKNIVLQIEFEDSLGKHKMVYLLSVNIQNRVGSAVFLIILIIILAFLYVFLRRKSSKTEEKKEKPKDEETKQKEVSKPEAEQKEILQELKA